MQQMVNFTNAYAESRIASLPKHAKADGTWKRTDLPEMYKLLALLLFQGFHPLPAMRDYWRTEALYAGNYARQMISSRNRYEALMCFLKVIDHTQEDGNDRLRKILLLHDHMREKCQALYRPGKCVSVDESMVKCKGCAPFTQYLPKKPVKGGFFAACDADTSIIVNFEVYTGQQLGGEHGLTHAVVMRLVGDMAADHVIYTDNFYTSPLLATSLREKQMSLVGTIRPNRQGFPPILRADIKQFERWAERGTTRYVRQGDQLFQQWKDKRCVSMFSNVHLGHQHDMITRNVKVDGMHQVVEIRRPLVVADYNGSMGGVDTFDYLIATYRSLRKTRKYWKSLFLDLVDVSASNAYRLFHLWMTEHPDNIQRRKHFKHSDFQAHLIRQMAGIDINDPPRKRRYRSSTDAPFLDSHNSICPTHRSKRKIAKTVESRKMCSASV